VFAPGLGAAEQRDRLRRIKQAQELTVVWRYLVVVTDIDRYSRGMTALAEATLAAGWLMALGAQVERHGVPRDVRGRLVPAVIVGLGKLGGRELTTGSDLDLFGTFGRADAGTADGETDGPERVDAHTFYSGAVERLASALGDITPAGIAFAVDLRLRPGSKGSGFAAGVDALERYYEEHGDLWERQSLTRARLLLGDRALARRVRATLRRLVYGAPLPAGALKEIRDVRRRMEVELGKETRGPWQAKLRRAGRARARARRRRAGLRVARRVPRRVPRGDRCGARGGYRGLRVSKRPALYVVDGDPHIFRAYHAIGYLSTSRGVPSDAVLILSTMLWKLIREEQPDYLGIALDPPGPTFRDSLFAAYKATRPASPDT